LVTIDIYISPTSPIGDISDVMERATVTIPDDLEKAMDSYVRAQEAPPPLTAVVQAALREYLAERGFFQSKLSAVPLNHRIFLGYE
jgi:hypothetical protein